MAIDFKKLRKHTENVLAYELDGEELFQIKPSVQDRTEYLRIKKQVAKNKGEDIQPFVNFLYNLFLRDSPSATEEERVIAKQFIENNIDELILQTDIGFRLTTKEEIQKQQDKFFDALLQKNLN